MAWFQRQFSLFKKLAARLRPMRIPLHGAYTSFFFILSLFPSLSLFLGLLKYAGIPLDSLLVFLSDILPQALVPTVESLIRAAYSGNSGTVISISAVTALWSASRGMYGMVTGLRDVYATAAPRSYWHRRLASVLYTFFFLLVLTLTLLAHIFGTAVLDYLWMTTTPTLMLLMSILDLRFLLLLLLQTGLFSAMYAFLSGKRRLLRDCFPGAVFASLGWLIFSRMFSVYVEYAAGYTSIFGSVYALALGMLWLYFCVCIVFYGGALNRILEEKGK